MPCIVIYSLFTHIDNECARIMRYVQNTHVSVDTGNMSRPFNLLIDNAHDDKYTLEHLRKTVHLNFNCHVFIVWLSLTG